MVDHTSMNIRDFGVELSGIRTGDGENVALLVEHGPKRIRSGFEDWVGGADYEGVGVQFEEVRRREWLNGCGHVGSGHVRLWDIKMPRV